MERVTRLELAPAPKRALPFRGPHLLNLKRWRQRVHRYRKPRALSTLTAVISYGAGYEARTRPPHPKGPCPFGARTSLLKKAEAASSPLSKAESAVDADGDYIIWSGLRGSSSPPHPKGLCPFGARTSLFKKGGGSEFAVIESRERCQR